MTTGFAIGGDLAVAVTDAVTDAVTAAESFFSSSLATDTKDPCFLFQGVEHLTLTSSWWSPGIRVRRARVRIAESFQPFE